MTRRPKKEPDGLRALHASVAEAVKQARLAYEFCPGSYTHSTLNACLRADKHLLAVLGATPPPQKPLAPQHCPAAQSADSRLRPEAEPRPSEVLIPDPRGRKAGPKAQAAAGDSRKQYRVQLCPFLPGAFETRQSREGETGRETCMGPSPATA
jgi:hypothetical protein